MSANEEVEEHVHHAQNPFDKTVAGSMAIMAALLAVVSVVGQHFNTEKLLLQGLASDQWAYSQAKDIRHYIADATRDILTNMKPVSAKTYEDDAKKYKKQAADIQEKAKEYEQERDKNSHKADRFHFSEVFLEVAIVFSSLSILLKVKPFFIAGIAAALVGIAIAVTGWWA